MTCSAAQGALLALLLLGPPATAAAQAPPQPQAPAPAQTAQPPGPYVIDLRGTTIGIPNAPEFFPSLPTGTAVPARGFGFDAGAHVYPFALGPARIGLGANMLFARSHIAASGVTSTVKVLAPQISFNFGTREGWSYLSAGYGSASLHAEAPLVTTLSGSAESGTGSALLTVVTGGARDTGRVGALNLGGGARWFLGNRVALGLDVRFHRLGSTASTPRVTLVSAAIGMSVR